MIKNIVRKFYSYEFIRYSIGGGLAALLDLFLLWLCTDVFGNYYLVSVIIAFIVSISFAFIFQKYITFKDKSKEHLKQCSLFIMFQLIGQLIYMGILFLGVDVLGFYYMSVAVIGKLIVFVRNYLSNHFFNFKK